MLQLLHFDEQYMQFLGYFMYEIIRLIPRKTSQLQLCALKWMLSVSQMSV